MRRNHICPGQWFVAVLLLAIGLSTYGCKDSVSVSEDVEVPLASLSITPGTLRPAFFSNTTSYVVDAPTSATSVTVTATPKDSTTTMMINGIPTLAGQGRSVTLGQPGSTTTITIVLEAPNGTETTYTVTVTRLLSDNSNLSDLKVKVGNAGQPLVPVFDANVLDYTVNVAHTVEDVTVVAIKSDKDATMVIRSAANSVTVGPGPNAEGQLPVTLGAPGTTTPVSIEVTAPNGSKKTYQIAINRLSGDNNLKELTVIPGTFNRPFDPGTTDYIVDVATEVEQVTVKATKSDSNAAMSGSVTAGPGTESGTAPIALGGPGSDTDVLITVAATDPTVPHKDYRITVKRALPAVPPPPASAPDLISEDDSCFRDPFTNECVPGSDEDDITNVTTPRFKIPQPGAGVTPSLYVDGNKDALASFDSAANTLMPSSQLNVGAHAITYTLANAGGESAQSPPLTVFISPF